MVFLLITGNLRAFAAFSLDLVSTGDGLVFTFCGSGFFTTGTGFLFFWSESEEASSLLYESESLLELPLLEPELDDDDELLLFDEDALSELDASSCVQK